MLILLLGNKKDRTALSLNGLVARAGIEPVTRGFKK